MAKVVTLRKKHKHPSVRAGKTRDGIVLVLNRDTVFVISFGILIALCAWVWNIGVPFTTAFIQVPAVAAVVTGAVLGSRRGILAVFVSLAAIALQLTPIDGSPGGINRFYEAGFAGFLWALPLAAFVTGKLCEKGLNRNTITTTLAMLSGLLIFYALGIGLEPHYLNITYSYKGQIFTENIVQSMFIQLMILLLASALLQAIQKITGLSKSRNKKRKR